MEGVQLGIGGPPGRTQGAASGWRAISRVLRGGAADIVNVLFPSDCRLCGAPILGLSRVQVCAGCVARVQPRPAAPAALCSRCGDTLELESVRFAASMGATECMTCRLAPPEFARAVAFAVYDDEVRDLLHLLKFNGMSSVAEHVLGAGIAQAMLQFESSAASELVVVPVPLFAARLRSRGFNQAELLARAGLARLRELRPQWKLTLQTAALRRIRDTNPLYDLSPRQRRQNLRGAFLVEDPELIRGREILLVDDIMTTGATARECSRTLLAAGAAKVWVATLARAQAEGHSSAGHDGVARWDAPPVAASIATPSAVIEPQAAKRQTFS